MGGGGAFTADPMVTLHGLEESKKSKRKRDVKGSLFFKVTGKQQSTGARVLELRFEKVGSEKQPKKTPR